MLSKMASSLIVINHTSFDDLTSILAVEAVVGISIGAVLVGALLVGLVVFCCKRNKERRIRNSVQSECPESGVAFKIQTLGRQYKLASIPNADMQGGGLGRHFSFDGDDDGAMAAASRKISTASSSRVVAVDVEKVIIAAKPEMFLHCIIFCCRSD